MIKIKKIREKYDFPVWLIKETLEYYGGDEDAAIKKLIEIYSAVGDHPDVAIKKILIILLKKLQLSKVKGEERHNVIM